MKFKVYFEIYGKKMMTVVDADAAAHAAEKVRAKLKIDKVTPVIEHPDVFEELKQIFWK